MQTISLLEPTPAVMAARETAPCRTPTITELLADPMTQAAMKADRVDVRAFELMLRGKARRLQARQRRLAHNEEKITHAIPRLRQGSTFSHNAIASRVVEAPLGWLSTW